MLRVEIFRKIIGETQEDAFLIHNSRDKNTLLIYDLRSKNVSTI